MKTKTLGLIGYGRMGRAVAARLVREGIPVCVFDAATDALEAARAAGLVTADSPRHLAREVDALMSVLPEGRDVEAAIMGPQGAFEGVKPGQLLIESSTIDPDESRRVGAAWRAVGGSKADAAIGRLPADAEQGNLVFMVGGSAGEFAAARAWLRCLGRDIVHCGDCGAGAAMKLVNNLLAQAILCADLEAIALGLKAGLSTEGMLRVLTLTAADNRMLHGQVEGAVLAGDFRPGFKAALAEKDLRLAEALAERVGVPLPVSGSARGWFEALMSRGEGDLGVAVVAREIARRSGIEFL